MEIQVPFNTARAELDHVTSHRLQLLANLFPDGIPNLWCPPITHYLPDGSIDETRIAAHLKHLTQYVRGFLIPGSTGDAWEFNESEFWRLLEIALGQAQTLRFHLLIGILKRDAREALAGMSKVINWLKERTGGTDIEKILAQARVCGFTICVSTGKQISQADMEEQLVPILEMGLPIALYQLPQVTENEIGIELLSRLVERFSNFILFKDSSGADRLAGSGRDLGGLFTMRGAEGDYVDWFGTHSRAYNGFLLSSANCFAGELSQMLKHISLGQMEHAAKTSRRVTDTINQTFDLVRGLKVGNVYSNANKAIDHFFAFGQGAGEIPGPRLYGGSVLPPEITSKTGEVLQRHGLMPREGYMG